MDSNDTKAEFVQEGMKAANAQGRKIGGRKTPAKKTPVKKALGKKTATKAMKATVLRQPTDG